jgi:branched-chain amino acid transport system permease protein
MSVETEQAGDTGAQDGLVPDWVGQYLRDHAIHILVIALFAIYPFFYDFVEVQFGLFATALLPETLTMLALLWLGLFAMSFDFISGYTGYLSFGHAAFFGIGAYVVVLGYNGQLPIVPAEMSFMPLMLLGATLAALFALLVGLISFRLSGVYFAMITLGVSELLFVTASNWDYLTTGGADPSEGIPAGAPTEIELFTPHIGVPFVDALKVEIGRFGQQKFLGIDFGEPMILSYFMIGLVVLLCYLSMQRIIHSPFGRTMIAIRENEERAKAIGYNTFWYKNGAFMISAFFGGIAGALMVSFQVTADPESTFFFLVTGFALIAAIIGGLGTIAGPMFGYIFLLSVEEFMLREGSGGGLEPLLAETLPKSILQFEVSGLSVQGAINAFITGHGEFYTGIIFVVFVLYVPIGLLGTLRLRLGARSVAGYVSERIGSRLSGDGDEDTDGAAD